MAHPPAMLLGAQLLQVLAWPVGVFYIAMVVARMVGLTMMRRR